jgi:hypothetical protein
MNALLFDFAECWRQSADARDWLDTWRAAEAACDAAAEAVRAACDAYKAERSPETEGLYRAADRAYNAARADYQRASFEIVTGIRALAGIARHIELADASKGRML